MTLVGRADELLRLTGHLASRQPVLVTGEPGLGKTTLLRAAARERGRPVFLGGGMPMLRSHPALPIERALGRRLPSADGPALAGLACAIVGGGTLLLDDLHWADEMTLDALPSLSSRVHLAMAMRPGEALIHVLERLGPTEVIELHPLAPDAAAELVRRLRPSLSRSDAEAIARRAGGNPLLLHELAEAPAGTPSLRLLMTARLNELDPEATAALLRLILLARPADPALLGPGAAAVVASGLAVEQDRAIVLRHALLGEAVLAGLAPTERSRMHAELARLVKDPGEAARHHADAGERHEARTRALEAVERATRPFERAAHLGVAALASDGRHADDLRLRAADELREAGEFHVSIRAARAVEATDRRTRARVALAVGRSLFELGDHAASDAAVAEGLALVHGDDDELEGRLLLQRAARRTEDWDAGAMEDVLRARSLIGTIDAEAETTLSQAHYVAGAVDDAATYAALGFQKALREGRPTLAVMGLVGQAAVAVARGDRHLADRFFAQAEQLADAAGAGRRRAWLLNFRGHLQTWQHGDYSAALATHMAALADPAALGLHLTRTLANQAVVLADLGYEPEATALLDRAALTARTNDARGYAAWLHGDLDWLTGRSARAIERLSAIRPDAPWALVPLIDSVLAWAALDLGRFPPSVAPERSLPLMGGFGFVDRAVRAIITSEDPAHGHELFLEAAQAFHGVSVRDRLRALWGAGEAARRAGDLATAREVLGVLEHELQRRGHVPLLARARRSLRLAGVRSGAAPGPRRGPLTAREDEVLELVAAGWTSAEIAARLALSHATVESHVRAARRKLGARSRATAVHVATRNGSDGELAAPPLVIVADGARAAAVADELRTAGWRTLDGWDIPATEWRVEQHRLVCHGPVRDADEAEAALRAAVRGAGLVAALDDREPFAAAFFESLRRLGTVQLRDGAPVLGPDLRRVLALVAGGASVAEVAALTHQSPRTVKRRLAAARAALGARTTAEAIRLLGAR